MSDIKPIKRNCPSLSVINFTNVSRQALGAINGNKPSIISIKPKANSSVIFTVYFLSAGAPLPPAERIYFKKSELESNTMTSLLLLKTLR